MERLTARMKKVRAFLTSTDARKAMVAAETLRTAIRCTNRCASSLPSLVWCAWGPGGPRLHSALDAE